MLRCRVDDFDGAQKNIYIGPGASGRDHRGV